MQVLARGRRGDRDLIEDVDERLQEWARTILPGVEIRFTPPDDTEAVPAIHCYLLDLLPDASSTAAGRAPLLQLGLRYLVTAHGDSPRETHKALGTLVFAAMEHPDFRVELDPPAAGFWSALGIVPRPAFMLRASLRLQRPEPKVGRVKKRVEVRHAEVMPLVGLLLGPGDLPVCDARVELESPRSTAFTDSQGFFRFAAVPPEPREKRLQIGAKGYQQAFTVEHPAGNSKPLVIHFETMEI